MPHHHHLLSEGAARLADAMAVGVTVGSIFGLLPAISTTLAILWMCIRIYETKTFQRWLGRTASPGNEGE